MDSNSAGMLQCPLLHSVLREKICIVFTRVDTQENLPYTKNYIRPKTLYADRRHCCLKIQTIKKINGSMKT